MDPVQPTNAERAIADEALSQPAAGRGAYLDRVCGVDGDLRRRVEVLLKGMIQAAPGRAPEAGLTESMGAGPPGEESPGDRIGRYKLLQAIGEGGCGTVYLAEQEMPVRRRVALKVIKLGMDTKEVVARFEAERQALAIMDHPNIARILDAGATEAGRPYFVMELVRGVKVTDFCDQNSLSVVERLGLFLQICQAVQHAHQKGIIHRDIKPSNILVTLNDGVAVPKVIDFGISKAMDGRLTDSTVFTVLQQFIGTPAYMSPEQADLSGIDIDTRSDIYSLGVLLYELLAGRPPFDPRALTRAGLDEMRRIIREVEPPTPSRCLSALSAGELEAVARMRGTDPARLIPLVAGDLDWIVMRCLEKNRTRRYETPAALAADITRHLGLEPVLARPPSRMYRVGKFARRNRLALGAAAALALALVAGSVISALQAVRATRAERLASLERGKADDERARVEDLLTFMLGDLRAQLERVGRLDVLEEVGDKAMAYFASLSPDDLDDTTLTRHAEALTQIGETRMAQGHYAEAGAAFSEAYGRASVLAARHPRNGDMLFERGQAEYWIGFVHYKRSESAAAKEWMTRYYETAKELVSLDPARPAWQGELAYGLHNLAVVLEELGEWGPARSDAMAELTVLEKMIASDPGNLDLQGRLADAHSWLGEFAERQGDLAEALRQYETQAMQFELLAAADPGTVGRRFDQAGALVYEVYIEMAAGKISDAGRLLRQAEGLYDTLAAHDASNLQWRLAPLTVRLIEAMLARQRGDPAGAGRLVDEALPQLEALSATEPSDRGISLGLATALRLKAQLQSQSNPQDARDAVKRAVEIGEKLARDGRASDDAVAECATAYIVAGEIASLQGDTDEPRREWLRAADLLAPRTGRGLDWRLLDPAARAAAWLGRQDEARATIRQLNLIGYVPLDPWPNLDSIAPIGSPVQQAK
jgi:tetratricopeptide (TPR) repeat protein/tRNA A-37 threonylcarbamoyl transferase component Bud32